MKKSPKIEKMVGKFVSRASVNDDVVNIIFDDGSDYCFFLTQQENTLEKQAFDELESRLEDLEARLYKMELKENKFLEDLNLPKFGSTSHMDHVQAINLHNEKLKEKISELNVQLERYQEYCSGY